MSKMKMDLNGLVVQCGDLLRFEVGEYKERGLAVVVYRRGKLELAELNTRQGSLHSQDIDPGDLGHISFYYIGNLDNALLKLQRNLLA